MEQKKLVPKRRVVGFAEEWKEWKFSNLGTFGKTYSYSRAKEGQGNYYHIHYGDIHTKNFGVIKEKTRIPTLKIAGKFEVLKKGDIVIADASEDYKDLGKTVVIGETANRKIIAGLHTFKFTPNKHLCSIYYLYYSQSHIFKKFSYKSGTGISVFGISKENISKMMLKIPSLKEQQKIGEFFKLLDERIANQERKVGKVKALKSAYLAEMFPQEGEIVPKRRFKGFNTEWETKILSEVADIVGGGTPSTSVKEYWGGEIDWYSPVEIGNRIFVNESQKKITKYGLENSSANILPKGTILFTSRAGIGKTAILQKEATTNQGFQSIVPIKNKLNSYFIFSQSEKLKRYGEKNSAGSTFLEISGKQMEKMVIHLPNIEEQQKIGAFFKNLDDQITNEEKKLEKLKQLKKAYLEEMFV